VGNGALLSLASGDNNTAVGNGALQPVTSGSGVTALGAGAGASVNGLTNATAIGFNASVAKSNSVILGSGAYVGIGTSSPNAPLHVSGSGITAASQARTWFDEGSALTTNTSASGNILIQADGWYWANGGGYVATSDARIKNILGNTDNACDLQTLAQLQITDYKYIDRVANGDKLQKKVIAQQVKEVYPQALTQMEGIIPSVYDTARSAKVSGDLTIIETMKPHGFKTGDEVKLITEKSGQKVLPVIVIDDHTFTVATPINERVFVYGKKVNDLLTVDYDAISMLNVSATQELYKMLLDEKAKNQLLEKKISELQDQNQATQSDVNKLKASIENLQQVIGSKAQK
jgi:hypothetical protein